MRIVVCFLFALAGSAIADIYLHNPRGSNNRLNERSANRQNANRAFDSQNNNRGGYNVGDKTSGAARNEDEQYHMSYFQSSNSGSGKTYLTMEWTNQHGCGGNEDSDPHKMNCQLVLQYMCQEDVSSRQQDTLRNGAKTNTQGYSATDKGSQESEAQYKGRKNGNVKSDYVMHEAWEWYDKCRRRIRNKGLFTADQKLNGDESIYTRQNPGGTRRGYECPEERDYYPYWHPTDWKDIAVLTTDPDRCSYYKKESFNMKTKGECIEKYSNGNAKHWSKYNDAKECAANGGTWTEFTNYLETAPGNEQQCKAKGNKYVWGLRHGHTQKECLVRLDEPDCKQANWTRVNHLGNGREGVPLNYTWTIPSFPSGKDYRCIFRIRYNISTDDYDPWQTDATSNQNLNAMKMSPVQQNPVVDVGAGMQPLRLAINTAQYGRTFQDRSHLFKLITRTKAVSEDQDIYNLNVRGKRGNIVQTFPAVEYDFVPNDLTIKSNDLLHIQWTGSNSHNNGNPAGDGQAGDSGEGTAGTDRNNIVEIMDPADNYPLPWERAKLFKNAQVKWTSHAYKTPKPEDVAISFASSGYFSCLVGKNGPAECKGNSPDTKGAMNNQLNNAPASYAGMVLQLGKGDYYYACSRNNNFSNRSQKGRLYVK
ncbi:predicted protein [Nematostella vectensis]|uniref:Protein DD3-3 n=1 Tax=Nematostella vectensis TaxID=45351 RepID=A7SGR6_NEMVE|nr:predicted protein [Nematostella vectensis]|eukprot:XP_001629203.1 predicted protein [Nematostella vectensis]